MVRDNIAALEGYVPGEQPQGNKFIKLNTNENPYPCSPKVKAMIGRVVQAGLQKYPDPSATAFRAQAVEVLRADCPQLDIDWMLCGNGSDDILTIITRTLVDQGGVIRYAHPGYVLYKTLAEIQGATCDVVSFRDDWSLDESFTAPRERLQLAFLANPNSPSGTNLSPDEVSRIAAALPCPLVVDEAYVDFAETNCLSLVAKHDNVLVTRSLSKSYALAGLRFGFVVAQPALIAELAKVKDSYNCDALATAGATAAIADRGWFDEARGAVLATRARLTTALEELGFVCTPSQANFVWCRHPAHDCEALYQQLKSSGILVRYMAYDGWEPGLRISVGSDEQIDALLEVLKQRL